MNTFVPTLPYYHEKYSSFSITGEPNAIFDQMKRVAKQLIGFSYEDHNQTWSIYIFESNETPNQLSLNLNLYHVQDNIYKIEIQRRSGNSMVFNALTKIIVSLMNGEQIVESDVKKVMHIGNDLSDIF